LGDDMASPHPSTRGCSHLVPSRVVSGDKEAVGNTHRVVDELVMSEKGRTRWWRPPRSFPHVLSTSFVCATPASFSFGAIQGETEAECLGDDMASPHPSTRGGASWWGRPSRWVVMRWRWGWRWLAMGPTSLKKRGGMGVVVDVVSFSLALRGPRKAGCGGRWRVTSKIKPNMIT